MSVDVKKDIENITKLHKTSMNTPKEDIKVFSVDIPRQLHSRIKKLSKSNMVSMTSIFEYIMDRELTKFGV